MRLRAVQLVGQDQNSRRTQIEIVSVEKGYICRGEITGQREVRGKLDNAIAVGLASIRNVVPMGATFRSLRKNVAGFVGGDTDARLPDGSQSVVGRGVEYSLLRQGSHVVRQEPAAVTVIAVIRAEAQIENAIQ